MDWIQITFESSAKDAERLSETLSELDAASVSLKDSGDQPIFEPELGTEPLWGDTQVVALFPGSIDLDALMKELSHRIRPIKLPPWKQEPLEERDWTREWMTDFKPIQFGERIWVVPSWHEPPEPEAINIMLDPGLAFGSGTHPTTALCLEWLDGLDLHDKQVIDYGCGSGILAIAAAKLGARAALGIDIDPQALTATRDNAEQNGVAEKINVALPENAPEFETEVVVANILAGPLVELAPQLSALLPAGGQIGLSGILEEQAKMVRDAYLPFFAMAEPVVRDDWVRLSGVRLD
ncbi:ribosomal protein L11 methyltransferase [Solemya pervernicosa gill symbiont]|uniref:Ribosomal protein L11 methyltransferase n=2 Tax=Gammaproteobacteria incertae sedis TaxID=118884 RepID=A0A1T2L963_9GAMM|nr:50S ribosomal protein L11 methyltransferase [Candidatus Reidiella endopervernicosa]OOZ41574.1 ribosomal protein L11 methyltransferase [Solemya pervernicosa gill symbiont]QKQ27980.1 50S ribosomal protein L11 methyltransferase [Candidatus Reidiella endopervernicosa]